MEKVISTIEVVEKYLAGLGNLIAESDRTTDIQFIKDSESKNYLLIEFGFQKENWVYRVIVHLKISETDEVIVLWNSTEIDIFDELEAENLDRNKMIVGWVPTDTWEAFSKHQSAP